MRTRRLDLGRACLITSAVLGLALPAGAEPQRRIVPTDSGPVSGIITPNGQRFLGIPYAAPPVGTLRWRPPEPALPWGRPRDASMPGSSCPQFTSLFGTASTNEDCLFLNVYTPPDDPPSPPRGRPVMVFIHGGGFVAGEGAVHDPRPLTQHGVVVVTLNYRLGPLGFIAHPELTAESPDHASGNYGLMDQQAALRWVQHNIKSFGGDPSNVTIFGESAGGQSVLEHLVSTDSAGLFSAAIVESGAYAPTQPSLASSEAQGLDLQAQIGCPSLACMRAAPPAALLATETGSLTQYRPNLDGKVLRQSIGPALASGSFNRVPVIQGSTHDEYRLFVALSFDLATGPLTAEAYTGAVASTLGVPEEVAALIAQVYPLGAYPSPDLALAAVGTDAAFACPALAVGGWLQQYVPTWLYEFSDATAPVPPLPISFPMGAYHTSELQYLFDLHGLPLVFPPLSPAQQALSDAMTSYFTEFARSGDPNGSGTPTWARYQLPLQGNVQQLVSPTPQPGTATAFALDHKCAFWAALSGS